MANPGANVLLVEDDDGIAVPLAAALRGAGYVVQRVAAGGEALQAIARGAAPDLVVLDLGLPDLDGVEVCPRACATASLRCRSWCSRRAPTRSTSSSASTPAPTTT